MARTLHQPPTEPAPAKRAKALDPVPCVEPAGDLPFADGLFDPANVHRLAAAHDVAQPYKFGLVNELFEPKFMHAARKEMVDQLSYRAKETDIYKINQTGDLVNLSGLPAAELALVPNVHRLRDALYSTTFRNFVRSVTGCGPLSGINHDMACNIYSEGCYLLTHDDVIGTRRVSYILYLPVDEPKWEPEWGGALELYPIAPVDPAHLDRPNVPTAKPTVTLPPAFNQFAFFVVTPGYSFHSVEEVVVEGDGVKGGVGARVSLQGWFHAPIEGEEGYEGVNPNADLSTLQQLYDTALTRSTPYPTPFPLPLPISPSPSDASSLTFLNPAYLDPSTLSLLRTEFIETSHLALSNFLHPNIAIELESLLRFSVATLEHDRHAPIAGRTTHQIPPHTTGENPAQGWTLTGPPHIQRFLAFSPPPTPAEPVGRLESLLGYLGRMFASEAFRTWLAALTALVPVAHTLAVRRFRPGLDYTLARGEPADGSARLDVGLGLTPSNPLWGTGEVGGWGMWVAPEEEGGDEATYGGGKLGFGTGEGEEEGTLLAVEPGWNTLNVVLRDAGVMKFVKYVAARAEGSRWDVGGEWEVEQVEGEEGK